MSSITPTLLVMAGGAIGAALRFHAGRLLGSLFSWGVFPVGTLMINIVGGFFMGILMAILLRDQAEISPYAENYRLLLGVGLLGGFTTFSAFSLEMAMMIERGQWGMTLFYAALSVALALLALFVGMVLIRWAL